MAGTKSVMHTQHAQEPRRQPGARLTGREYPSELKAGQGTIMNPPLAPWASTEWFRSTAPMPDHEANRPGVKVSLELQKHWLVLTHVPVLRMMEGAICAEARPDVTV